MRLASARTRRRHRATEWPGTVALALVGAAVAVHALGLGGWSGQMICFRVTAPVLTGTAAWLCWLAADRVTLPGARRFWRLVGSGLGCAAAGYLAAVYELVAHGDQRFPTPATAVQLGELAATVLFVAATLALPVRTRWSSSRLRLGLDMATVLLSAVVFLWYFSIGPAVTGRGDPALLASLLAQSAGVMVALFAMTRVAVAGVAGVARRSLALTVAAGLAAIGVNGLARGLPGTPHMHLALILGTLFPAFMIMAARAQRRVPRSARTTDGPDTGRRRPFSTLPYAAVAATDGLLVAALARHTDLRTWAVLGGAIVLTGLVVSRQVVALRDNAQLVVRLDDSLTGLRQSMARQETLADIGTALLTTTDTDAIHGLVTDAATRLLVGHPGALVTIADPATDPPPVAPGAAQIVLPIGTGHRIAGLLRVGTDHELPPEVHKSLETLCTQAALALDSADLTIELTRRALHDPLTGLANRTLLRERLVAALADTRRSLQPTGVLLLDLNGFKEINDTLGHDAGDDLLRTVGDRLLTCVRHEDTVGRLGGDEFVVVLSTLAEEIDAILVSERITAVLAKPIDLAGRQVTTPASVGLALSQTGTDDADDLLRQADSAMYAAKRRRRAEGGQTHHPAPTP